jgi:Flp pilus assembly protein TadG
VSWLRRRLRPDGREGDSGQLLLLVLAYFTIACALVGVAVDASAYFLAQRSLSATADGAALAAAQSVDERSVYGSDRGLAALPLSATGVGRSVQRYLVDDDAYARFPDLVPASSTDGVTVTVRLRVSVPLPFSGAFLRLRGPADLAVTADARAPLRG